MAIRTCRECLVGSTLHTTGAAQRLQFCAYNMQARRQQFGRGFQGKKKESDKVTLGQFAWYPLQFPVAPYYLSANRTGFGGRSLHEKKVQI